MWKFVYASALASLVAATTDNPQVNVTCADDSDVIIDIGYDRSTDLLKLVGGSCNETSVEYSQNNVTNAVQITLNMRDCDLRSAGSAGNEALAFQSVVEVSLGRSDDGTDMVFYHNNINLTCSVQTDYEVSLFYGEIDADYSSDETMAGGEQVFSFGIRSTDSDFNETQVPSNRAGDTVYLDIYADDVDFNRYKFGVKSCTFKELSGNSVVTEYNLFNNTENSCKNDFLDFSINYCNTTNSFKISHTVFTFDPSRQNNYTLSCAIKLCDFDVVDSVSQCEAFESNCGIDTIMPTEIVDAANVTGNATTTAGACADFSGYELDIETNKRWEHYTGKIWENLRSYTVSECKAMRLKLLENLDVDQQQSVYTVDDGLKMLCQNGKKVSDMEDLFGNFWDTELKEVTDTTGSPVAMSTITSIPFVEFCQNMCADKLDVNPTGCVPPPPRPCVDDDEWLFEIGHETKRHNGEATIVGNCKKMKEDIVERLGSSVAYKGFKDFCMQQNIWAMNNHALSMKWTYEFVTVERVGIAVDPKTTYTKFVDICEDVCASYVDQNPNECTPSY